MGLGRIDGPRAARLLAAMAGLCTGIAEAGASSRVGPLSRSLASVYGVQPVDTAIPEMPESASRYYRVLQRNPEPGYLFDRFCGAWLADHDPEDLEAFLADRADAGDAADGLLLAYYYIRDGRNVDAIRRFRETLESDPGNGRGWFEKAKVEASTLDFETALRDLAKAHENSGGDLEFVEEVGKLRGKLLIRTGQPEQAAQIWKALLALRPNDEALREDLIQLRVDEGLYEDAIGALGALIEKTPDPRDRVARRLWLAEINQRANKGDEALAIYESALADVGTGSWFEREILALIETVYRRKGELPELAAKLGELAGAHPERIEIQKRLARLHGENGDIDDAVASWESIIRKTPGERSNRVALARLLAEHGRTEEAIERLEALLEQNPDPSLRIQIAELHATAGNAGEAAAQMRRYVADTDGGVSAVMRAVRVLERAGEVTAALELMRGSASANAGAEGMREALAEVEYRIGEKDRAIETWRAIAAEADNADGVMRAARSLIGRNETEAGYGVLTARADEFADDALYAQALTEAAARAQKPDEALDASLRWVRLTPDAAAGGQAVSAAARLAKRQVAEGDIIAELRARGADRTIGETCLLAVLEQAVGELDACDATLAASSDEPRAVRTKADLLIERGSFVEALSTLESLLGMPGVSQASTVRELIELSARTGQREAALAWVERWKSLAPGSVMPWVRGAEILAEKGDVEEAIDALESIHRRERDDPMVARKLASMYVEAGRERDAERVCWDMFESADSTQTRMRWINDLAELAGWTGAEDRLIEVLEARRAGDRRNAEPSLLLAEAYRAIGDEQARREALVEASRLEPRNLSLILQIASVEQASGEIDRALASLRRAEELDTSGRVRPRIAELLVMDGRMEEAVELASDPENPMDSDAVLGMADAMAGLGEWDASASFLEQQTGSLDDYRVDYVLGAVLEEAGRGEEAQRYFLRVIECDEERPGVSANPMQGYAGGWYDMLPPETTQLIEVLQSEYQAYSHSNYGGYGAGYGYSGGRTISKPGRLAEAKSWSLLHLSRIGSEYDEAGRDLLGAALARRGVRLADVILDLPAGGGMQDLFSSDLVERHPDDPAVLALGVLYGSYGMGGGDAEMYDRAVEIFDDRYPELAMLARVGAFQMKSGEDADAAWESLEAAVRDVDDPEPFVMMSLASLVSGESMVGIGAVPQVEGERGEFLLGTLLDWFGKIDRTSQWHQPVFMAMVGAVGNTGDASLLADLIAREVDAHRANPRAGGQNAMSRAMSMMGGRGSSLQRLGLPPAELQGIPGSVISMMSDASSMMFGGTRLDTVKLAEGLAEGDDELLRAVVAAANGDEETMLPIVEGMVTGESPSLDGFLLLAAYAGDQGDSARAVELLGEATYLPMNRATRERVDAAIVAYALETELEGETASLGQRSALRLLYATRDPATRQAIADSLDRLGLTEEAERERDKLAANQNHGGITTPWMGGGGRQPGALDRIVDAFDNDRMEAGVRLAVRDLEAAADQLLQGNSWAIQQQEVQSLVDLLGRRGVEDRVIEEADPGERGSAVRLARFGGVLEALDKPGRAAEAYASAFESRPDAGVGGALIRLRLEAGDAAGAAEMLKAVPARQMMNLVSTLQNLSMNQGDDDYGTVLAFAEMASIYLETIDEVPVEAEPICSVAMSALTGPYWNMRDQIPPLYAIDPDVPASLEGTQEKRFEAHARLVEAMLASPAMAEAGFEAKTAIAQLDSESVEGLVDLAERVLTAEPDTQGMNNQMAMMQRAMSRSFRRYDDETEIAVPRSAMDLLAEHCAGRPVEMADESAEAGAGSASTTGVANESLDGRAARAERVIATLNDQNREDDAETFASFVALYGAPEDAFGDEVAGYLEAEPGRMARVTGVDRDRIAEVCGIIERRGIDPTLAMDAILDRVGELVERPMNFELSSGSVPSYAKLVADRDLDKASAFADGLAERLVGPSDEREAIIERHYQPNTWTMGSKSASLRQFVEIIQQAYMNEPDTVWIAARLLEPFPLDDDWMSINRALPRVIRSVFTPIDEREESGTISQDERREAIVRFVKESPFVADGDDFEAYPGDEYTSGCGFLDTVSQLARPESAGALKEIHGWFDELDSPPLGLALLVASIEGYGYPRPYAVLESRRSDIEALDAETRAEVLVALGGESGIPPGLSDEAMAVVGMLKGATASRLEERTDEYLDSRANSMGGSPYEFVQETASLLADLADANEMDLVDRVIEHGMKELKRAGPNSFGYTDELSMLVENMVGNERVSPSTLGVCIRLIGESDEGVLRENWRFTNALKSAADWYDESSEPKEGDALRSSKDRFVSNRTVAIPIRGALLGVRAAAGDADSTSMIALVANTIQNDETLRRMGRMDVWARERAAEDPSAFWADVEAGVYAGELAARKKEDDTTEQAEALASFLTTLATRDTTPAPARCMTIGRYIGLVADAGVDTTSAAVPAMHAAMEVLADDPDLMDTDWVRPIIEARLGSPEGEGWPPVADFVDAIIRATLRSSGSRQAFSGQPGASMLGLPAPFSHADPDERPEQSTGLLALELALRDGADDQVDRLIRTPATGLRETVAAWVMLTEERRPRPGGRGDRRRVAEGDAVLPSGARVRRRGP